MKATNILREYGEAIRGDWSEIDGRTVRDQLDYLAELIETNHNAELTEQEAIECRDSLGICLEGNGHWLEYCEEYGCKDE